MAFSDDESDRIVHDVSEYHFVDGKDEPVSFVELPIVWGNDETSVGEVTEIFLRGYTDNHHLSVYKKVKAWRFDISLPNPEISVLSSEGEWIKLLKARNSYLEFIRTVVITVHFLHLLKNKVDTPFTALWDKLSKRFSFEEKPCGNDLRDHISLIREAVERDDDLKDSNVLSKFLKNPMKKIVLDKGDETSENSSFIVDDSVVDYVNPEECDEEDDDFDLVCALCDNGGDLLSCEGRCLRSFHATTEAGCDSQCKSLGLSDEKVKRLPVFFCNNCQYNKHQCYACGKLGSSDKAAGPEVFRCIVATCGYFYHPHCVAKLLSPRNDSKAEELRGKISTGEQFTCPIHECYLCKKRENKIENDLQFAVCRRCPKAYHRKCLPREIAFAGNEDELVPRAWKGLLPYGRILIYCLDHEVDEDLLTPSRNHVIFPGPDAKKKRVSTLSSGGRISLSSEGASKKSRLVKQSKAVEKLSSSEKQGDSSKKTEKRMSFQRSSGQRKGGPSLRDMQYSLTRQDSDPDEQIHTGELEQPQLDGFGLAESDSSMEFDSYTIGRIFTMIKGTASKPEKVKLNENHSEMTIIKGTASKPEKVKLNENHNEMTKPNPPTECRGKSSMRVDDRHLMMEHEPSLEHRASVIEKEKSSDPENSQKCGSLSSRRHSREGEQGKKVDENLVRKSCAGKQFDSHNPYSSKRFKGKLRGNPFNPEHRQARQGSDEEVDRRSNHNDTKDYVRRFDENNNNKRNMQRQARYGSSEEVDRRSNCQDTEDSVWRSDGNNDNKMKGNMRNEGPSKWEDTTSRALGHSFRNPHEQFLEGGRGKKMKKFPVKKSYAGKRSDLRHLNNSSLKRCKGFSNRKFLRGKPSNVERRPVSSSDTQRRAKNDSGGNIDLRSNTARAEDSVRRFNGNNKSKQKGYNHAPDMQRCAPRMDESNHSADRNGMNNPRHGHPTSQWNCLGFASSPCSSYLNGSCGWIDE